MVRLWAHLGFPLDSHLGVSMLLMWWALLCPPHSLVDAAYPVGVWILKMTRDRVVISDTSRVTGLRHMMYQRRNSFLELNQWMVLLAFCTWDTRVTPQNASFNKKSLQTSIWSKYITSRKNSAWESPCNWDKNSDIPNHSGESKLHKRQKIKTE